MADLDLSRGPFEIDISSLAGAAHRQAFIEIFQAVLSANRAILNSITAEATELYDRHRDQVVLELGGSNSRALYVTFDNPSFELLETPTKEPSRQKRLEPLLGVFS